MLSFVYTITPLITSQRGTVVCNLYLSQLSRVLNPSDAQDGVYYVLDGEGNVLGHPDESLTRVSDASSTLLKQLPERTEQQGYFEYEEDGVRYLCAYERSGFNGWTYLASYNLEHLLRQSKAVFYKAIALIIVAVILETALVLLIFYRIFQPFRMLLGNVRQNMEEGGNDTEEAGGNEISYLSHAFSKMKLEESRIHEILKKKDTDSRKLLLREALSGSGDGASGEQQAALAALFPYRHYIVMELCADRPGEMQRNCSAEEFQYYFMQLEELFTAHFSRDGYAVMSLRRTNVSCVAILSIQVYDERTVCSLIEEQVGEIRKVLAESFPYSFTVGVGAVHADVRDLRAALDEATGVVRKRIVNGEGRIFFWNAHMTERQRYFYPYDSENRIANYLKQRDFDAVCAEIRKVSDEIVRLGDLSYENVVMIYQQLTGLLIRSLSDDWDRTLLHFGRKTYAAIAEKLTVQEIQQCMVDFIELIRENVKAAPETDGGGGIYARIIDYLNQHYREDIDFESAAQSLGISYSYLRRMMREQGGISPADYVNRLRIRDAKELLATTSLRLSDIAEAVGYHNVQSLNRFFKKYEGTTPNAFRE